MTAITIIHLDYEALPEHFDMRHPETVALDIEAAMREAGIEATTLALLSHLKLELPTRQLRVASTTLAELQLI